MSGFGWSAGDVVLAAKFIAKVVKALKKTGGAGDEYQQAIEFLSGLEQTLQNLASAGNLLPQNAATLEILTQTKRIVDLLGPLHGQLKKAEATLGTAASGDPATRLKSKLKWAFQQSKQVEKLEDAIAVPLATINANIGLQILSLVAEIRSDLPAATCDVLSARINDTILSNFQTQLHPVSQAIERQASSSAMALDSMRTCLAAQVSEQRAAESALADKINEVQTGLKLLRTSVETNAAALDHTAISIPTSDGNKSQYQKDIDPRDRMVQSLHVMAHSIRELLLAILELAWPFLVLFLRKLEATRRHLSRQIMGDSILFEDALGRPRYLPYEFFQHWDVFHSYLTKTFEEVPGAAYYLAQGRYHLLNSNTGAIVDPRVWKMAVKVGSRISMSIVTVSLSNITRACPCCGGIKTWTGFHNFVTCSTCSAAYRLFEPRRREHLQPRDGSGWLNEFVNGWKPSTRAKNLSHQPYTTVPFSTVQSRITELGQIKAQNLLQERFDLTRFKKIDIILINEPGKIADTVEEMMSLVLQFKNSGKKSLSIAQCASVYETVALIRAEAKHDVGIFDFELEDNVFMELSKDLIENLSDAIASPYLSDVNHRYLPLKIKHWKDWISNRIVCTLRQDILSGQVQDPGILLVLKSLAGRRVMIRVQQTTPILELKYMLQKIEGTPSGYQYLVSGGRKLENHRLVLDYNLNTQDYVHMLLPIWGHTPSLE